MTHEAQKQVWILFKEKQVLLLNFLNVTICTKR
jgi:hypothetical protein